MIGVGDIIKTSYDTGPYEVVKVIGPTYCEKGIGCWVIYETPVVSLICIAAEGHHLIRTPTGRRRLGRFYFNEVREVGGRFYTGMIGSEIIIIRKAIGPLPGQLALFELEKPDPQEPYQFQEGVDYRASGRQVWKCVPCDRDFNAPPVERWGPPTCPECWSRYHLVRLVLAEEGRATYPRTL